jgi:transposase InsO family protein
MTFLRNHRDAIAAMDFFVVSTLSFRILYVWFVIEHDRRRILHFHVTDDPNATWVVQQLRQAFPLDTAPRHLVFDRDATYSARVVSMVKSLGTKPTRTAPQSPWQNGVAERWIGSVRREFLDHVVVFNDRHLLRLLRDYVAYHQDDAPTSASQRPHPRAAHGRPSPLVTRLAPSDRRLVDSIARAIDSLP